MPGADEQARSFAASLRDLLWNRFGGFNSLTVSWPEASPDGTAGVAKLMRDNHPLTGDERQQLDGLLGVFAAEHGSMPDTLDLYFSGEGPGVGIEPYWAPRGGNERIAAGVARDEVVLTARLAHLRPLAGVGRFLSQLDARVCTAAQSLTGQDAAAFTGEQGADAQRELRIRVAQEVSSAMGTVIRLMNAGQAAELYAAWAHTIGREDLMTPGPLDEASANKVLMVAAKLNPSAAVLMEQLPQVLEDFALDLMASRFD